MLNLIHVGPAMAASFFGSAVEAVEATTIVLAVGITRGWRSALAGALAGVAAVVAIIAVAGNAIASFPVDRLQVFVGSLLLLFGIRWLRKAILRSAGIIPPHDEAAEFEKAAQELGEPRAPRRWDGAGIAATFKAVLLEGIEVVVIVVGLGAAGRTLVPASQGAIAACLLVALVALFLHRPLARVPENTLKFAVGAIMAAFGIFWFGEGVGIRWPYADATILGLMALLFTAGSIAVELAKVRR
jgi:uncharacterized membrane protein